MIDLDIKIYNKNFVSIKDFTGDLNISAVHWDALFAATNKLFDNIYFSGEGIWARDSDFESTINYLSEEVFFYTMKKRFEILFRIKNLSFMYNRKLVSKMWDYYEYPCFIFLDDNRQEDVLVKSYRDGMLIEDIIEKIEGLLIIYRSFEQDVLWIKSNVDVKKILDIIKFE